MDPARVGVILDSSILIQAERRRFDVAQFLEYAAAQLGPVEIALCSISVAELAHGVHRANTPERQSSRRAFLDDLKATVVIYSITADTAEVVGKVHAHCSRQGLTIPFDDLLIGCCALEWGYSVATLNERHFRSIPQLELIRLEDA